MKKDLNKEIINIEYNHLNLPQSIFFKIPYKPLQKYITYTYDATGVKLQKEVRNDVPQGYVGSAYTQYDNGFIYEHTGTTTPELQFFPHAEGYVEPNGNNYDYIYQYKDHLGNIRLSYKQGISDLEIVEENNYYPFGLEHKGYNNVVNGSENNYFNFNGKELNESHGLYVIEMDWRQYDASIGRFNVIDPYAEFMYDQTPYHFSYNSPL